MAANLDLSNNRVNYAYLAEHGSVWHGMGQVIPMNSPLSVWKEEAGLNWEALSTEVNYVTDDEVSSVFPKKKVLYRSDNKHPLSIVGSDYQIVQPSEIVDFFSDILDIHNMEMSSCGSLFDGKRIFATAKLSDMEIIPGDDIKGYLLITTSLDGSFATVAKTTSVRTVCSNTLTMALKENTANLCRVPHSTTFNAAKVKLNLGLIEDSQYRFIEDMRKLVNTSISADDAFAFYKETFYSPEVSAEDQHATIIKKVDDIMNLYRYGAGASFGKDTFYNVLQGVTDYYTHNQKARTESSMFWNNFYGNSEKIKLDVMNKLLEIAG